MKKMNKSCSIWVKGFFSLLLFVTSVSAQVPDGIPDPTGKFVPTNICYQSFSGPTCETFSAPEVSKDISAVKAIVASPRDISRSFDNLPNYGLAKFHWWLFSQGIHRAQREYAECVAKISELQLLQGEPLIDSPDGVDYPGIVAIKEYEIPFEAIQNISGPDRPPSLRDAIEHVKAAVATLNITVAAVFNCHQILGLKRQATNSYLSDLRAKALCKKKKKGR